MFFDSLEFADLLKLYKNYTSNINADIVSDAPCGSWRIPSRRCRKSVKLCHKSCTWTANISAALWQLQQQIEISAQLSFRKAGGGAAGGGAGKVHRVESRKNAKWQKHLIALAKLRAKSEFGAINWQGQAGWRVPATVALPAPAPAAAPLPVPLPVFLCRFQGEHSLRVSSLKLFAISCKLNYGCVAAKLFHFHFEQTFWQCLPSSPSLSPALVCPMRVGPQYHM